MAENPTRPLYDFAILAQFDEKVAELAQLAEPEDWEYKKTPTEYRNPILYYYVHYTFKRLQEEGKIAVSPDGEHACFNTGLVTPLQEPIFMLFDKNLMQGPEDSRAWHYRKPCRSGEHVLNCFERLPDLAHYFDDPSALVFDNRLELRANVEHIIRDNRERFPEPYGEMDNFALQTFLKGAIDNAKERVRRNYKTAIPQYYRGRVQLLLPLCIGHPHKADLAMVVERFDSFYRASTCLTLDMAYSNARQLARPDKDWLQP